MTVREFVVAVGYTATTYVTVTAEADEDGTPVNRDAVMNAAYRAQPGSLCHQCAARYELGDGDEGDIVA